MTQLAYWHLFPPWSPLYSRHRRFERPLATVNPVQTMAFKVAKSILLLCPLSTKVSWCIDDNESLRSRWRRG